MHIKLILLIFLLPFGLMALTPEEDKAVASFIDSCKDMKLLAKNIRYPLMRRYPLPSIASEKDFLERYKIIFNKDYLDKMRQSKLADWSAVGWRGIMLNHGQLWIGRDGKLIAVNSESPEEKKLRLAIIETDRAGLHVSLQKYSEPVLDWKFTKFRVRIDQLAKDRFRYSSWAVNSAGDSKPSLILEGKVKYDGSGGNHHYEFKVGAHKYILYVSRISADGRRGRLEVWKNNKVIMKETLH